MKKQLHGFTLVELMVSIVLMVVLLGASGTVYFSGMRSAGELTTQQVVDDRLRRGINRVVDAIRFSDPASFTIVTNGGQVTIRFTPIEGWADDAPVLGDPRELTYDGGSIEIDEQTVVTGVTQFDATYVGGVVIIMTSDLVSSATGAPLLNRSVNISLRL